MNKITSFEQIGGKADNEKNLEFTPWPEPQPTITSLTPEPYPLDALPAMIQQAVIEVNSFVKAPAALTATCALSAISLAIQSKVDIERIEGLTGPVALFLLSIAESGERKTTVDGYFMRPFWDYQQQEADRLRPVISDYFAEYDAWEAEKAGVKDAIRQAAKTNKPTAALKDKLKEIEQREPERPREPKLIYTDVTPEKLVESLTRWPSGGIVSSEAGLVFGSHGMQPDVCMRNLSTLNQLWDGKPLNIDRKTSRSFTVQGARLTVALQIQEDTLRTFFEKSGELARGSGFLARFLLAWPETTQGTRFHDTANPAPAGWPKLKAFNSRITEILNSGVSFAEHGGLQLVTMKFEPEARALWVAYYNNVEKELRAGGEFCDIRDVASKSADNVARLAACFEVFENGISATVKAAAVRSAIRVALWHLTESRRFFGEIAIPAEMAVAARLDNWLQRRCKEQHTDKINFRDIQQYGPGPLRKRQNLEAALQELAELDRLRVAADGRKRLAIMNPAIVGSQEPTA